MAEYLLFGIGCLEPSKKNKKMNLVYMAYEDLFDPLIPYGQIFIFILVLLKIFFEQKNLKINYVF